MGEIGKREAEKQQPWERCLRCDSDVSCGWPGVLTVFRTKAFLPLDWRPLVLYGLILGSRRTLYQWM